MVDTTDFDFFAFLDSGTVATREVHLFVDHEAAQRHVEIQHRIAELEDEESPVDELANLTIAESANPELDALRAEAILVEERLDVSRMVWKVQALSAERIQQIEDGLPDPKTPAPPKDNAGEKAREAWVARMVEHSKKVADVKMERSFAFIAAAVKSITTADGVKTSIAVDELRALRARPHGQQWLNKLSKAALAATDADVEPPAFLSRRNSTNIPV
ncbi:MAG: hypothetical protein FWG25_11270 [Promicromonosporaceae bacterium]|nr:hypothetical protein [Promicromonosporaceae bacterium]